MKARLYLILGVFIICLFSKQIEAQVNTYGSVNASIADENPFFDASATFDLAVTPSSSGKGFVFPRADLTHWVFQTKSLGDGYIFPGALDGMIVYNTVAGNTPVDDGSGNNPTVSIAVTPGYYYFSNPGPTDGTHYTITGGKWIRINDGHTSTTPSGIAFPTTPTPNAGDVFYRTDLKGFYYYNGTAWVSASGTPAGTSAPVSPAVGDTWYDTTASPGTLKIYDGVANGWVSVGGVANGSITEAKLKSSSGTLSGGAAGKVLAFDTGGTFKWVDNGSAGALSGLTDVGLSLLANNQ